jgi:hypothetical protein
MRQDKMVDDVDEGVERALSCLVSVTERSRNLSNDLRKDILEAVSSPRNYFVQAQSNLEAKTAAYKELAREVKESKDEIHRLRDASSSARHAVQSLDPAQKEYSGVRQVLPPDGKTRKLYSEVVKTKGNVNKHYKLTIKSKN